MKYTLIAFKPEESYWSGDEKEIHHAELIREDDLTEQDIIERISQLGRKPEYMKECSWLCKDCAYSDFHVFEYSEKTDEELYPIFDLIEKGLEKAHELNKEGERKQKEKWAKERALKDQNELNWKKAEYEKLKLIFESENKND